MRGTPGVAEVKASGTNTLPFSGQVNATVIADDGLDADSLMAVAEKIRSFDTSQSFSANLQFPQGDFIGDVSLSLVDPDVNRSTIEFVLKTGDAVDVRAVSISPGALESDPVFVGAETEADPLTVFDQLNELWESESEGPVVWNVSGSSWEISSAGRDGIQEERAALAAIATKFTVTEGQLKDDGMTVRVEADRTAANTGEIEQLGAGADITIEYGNVTVDDGKGNAQTDVSAVLAPLLSALEGRQEDISAEAAGTHLAITVAASEDIFSLDAALREANGYDQATLAYMIPELGLSVYNSDNPIARLETPVNTLAKSQSTAVIKSMNINFKEWRIEAASDLGSDELKQLGEDLRASVPEGTSVLLGLGLPRWLEFEARSKLSLDKEELGEFSPAEMGTVKAFREGWEG